MGGLTRFDCALGSHALMRRAYSVALYHALQRQAFGKNLVDQPMMRQVLGQMALRLEGQTAFLFRLARAWDSRDDAQEALWARLFTPAAKFAICKSGIPFVAEAMEVLGGSAIAKRVNCRVCTVRCRSTASGKAPAILCAGRDAGADEAAGGDGAAGGGVRGGERAKSPFRPAWRQLQQWLRRPLEEQGERLPGWSICWALGRRCCASLRRRWPKPGAG
jgi:putative acyl-CoA dehydrogenase